MTTRNIFEEAIRDAELLKSLNEMSLEVGRQWKEDMDSRFPEATIKRESLKPILKWLKLDLRVSKEVEILDFFKKVVEEDLGFKTSITSTDGEVYFTMESKWAL